MVFSSTGFLFIFLPVTVLLTWFAPAKLKNVLLALAGLLFYAWGSPKNLIFLLFSVLFNYMTGIEIAELRRRERPKFLVGITVLAVAANIAVLALFKYVVHGLPLGISFYTFTVLSYLFDLAYGRAEGTKNPLDFLLYVTFFPKVTSGPIVQYADMKSQISDRTMTLQGMYEGFCLFLLGLAKKVLIADALGTAFSAASAGEATILSAWLTLIFYSLQLYFDFSGYSDMAIGLAKIFGFSFEKNFDHPYLSRSIPEFWRRWHISLGNWFKQYVYFPMGGSRVSTIRLIFNTAVVWVLTGIWHGNTLNYLFWGLYHGFFVLAHRFLFKGVMEKLPAAIQILITDLIAMLGWVFFFTENAPASLTFLKRLVGIGAVGFADNNAVFVLLGNLVLMVIALIGCTELPAKAWNSIVYENKFDVNPKVLTAAVCIIGVFLLLGSTAGILNSTFSSFLYFAF